MRLRSDIALAPVDMALRRTAISERWFADDEDNHVLGFGRGPEGQVEFQELYFETALARTETDPHFRLVGIYNAQPCGFFGVEQLDPRTRTVDVFMYVSPLHRHFAVATTALYRLLDTLFLAREPIYRVQTQVLAANHRARKFLDRFGFRSEGCLKSAIWASDGTNPQPRDVRPMAILRPGWKKWKKEN